MSNLINSNLVEDSKSTATVFPFYVTQPVVQKPNAAGGNSNNKMVLDNGKWVQQNAAFKGVAGFNGRGGYHGTGGHGGDQYPRQQ